MCTEYLDFLPCMFLLAQLLKSPVGVPETNFQELKRGTQYYEGFEEDTLNLCKGIKMTTNCLELDPGILHFASTFLTSQCTAVQE